MKKYEELGFTDQFMFNKLMQDPNLCRRVLETLLQTKLSELTTPATEKEIKETADGKAIRLDVYTKDSENGAVYDAEMQNLNRKSVDYLALPERSRYYQSLIDSSEMKEGDDYSDLPESNIIFICTFDPFGKGLYRYSFSEYCEELPGFLLPSRTRKIFYNTTAVNAGMPKGVRNFFEYINTGKPNDEFTGDIERMLDQAKINAMWSREYAMQKVWERDLKEDARLEGLEEGREEGLKLGLEEGRAEGRAEGKAEGRAEGKAEGRIDSMVKMLAKGATKKMLKDFLDATDAEIEVAEKILSSDKTFSD